MQKIILFKGHDPLQLTIFHQSLLRHESAVAWSQQEPFQQLQTAAGSVAAWVCLLNNRSGKPFAAYTGWSLTKQADFYNILPSLPWTLFSWIATPGTSCSEHTRYILLSLSQQRRCSAATSSKPHMTEQAGWEVGRRDAFRCGCRGMWQGCSQSPLRNRVPQASFPFLQFADSFVRCIVQAAFQRKSLLVIRNF